MIRVLVADDHKIIRDGLKNLIDREPDMEVVGEAENGRDAVKLAQKLKPTIIIMDITMPDLNGIDATRQIISEIKDVQIIALSMHSDKHFVEQMLQAGVSGYLLKDCAFEELNRAVHTVASGRVYLCSEVAGDIVQGYVDQMKRSDPPKAATLSLREREVLQLIAEGHTTRTVSERLNISMKTVESHRKNIMDKLETTSIAELTKIALREGITSLET